MKVSTRKQNFMKIFYYRKLNHVKVSIKKLNHVKVSTRKLNYI